jgi:phosphohistidine phosphatase
MDLILWRHADAEEGAIDLERRLTPKGQKQAEQVAAWLATRLDKGYRVIASPAARAQQTAEALKQKIATVKSLAPGASVSAILKAAGWPDGDETVVLVGHQPDLGNAAAYLVSGRESDWRLKKGALWWIANGGQPLVRAVVSPDLL